MDAVAAQKRIGEETGPSRLEGLKKTGCLGKN
jgi:hypothetical protein